MAEERIFTIDQVFEIVHRAVHPYFIGKMAVVVDDNNKTEKVDLTDFVLRCVAEQLVSRWAEMEEVTEALQKNEEYEQFVLPTDEMPALKTIVGGSRRRSTRRRT